MKLHPKIAQAKTRASAINHRFISATQNVDIEKRNSLLDERIVEGYGCIWGSINLHNERFHKGAFARSIRENGPGSGAAYEIKFRNEHGNAMSLFDVLVEDDIGLFFRTKPLDQVQWADDFLTQLRSGTINNFSNGFNYIFEQNSMMWSDMDECIDIYVARLFEISGTAIPSDMETFAKRNSENDETLFDDTEEFIKSLPRKFQLEARHILARHKSLDEVESLDEKLKALNTNRPIEERAIDYNYLIKNL